MSDTCVVHLVRAANGFTPLRDFLDSYARHPAGRDHRLLLLFKGFAPRLPAEYDRLLEEVAHERRFIAERGFDIDAYLQLAREHAAAYFCFLNSFSLILADGWLDKLYRALVEGGAGLAGATGSWQSHADASYAPAPRPDDPAWKRALLQGLPFLRTAACAIRRRVHGGSFDLFPNHHLRTNAFMLSRQTALALSVPRLRSKLDAYKFESGKRGLTRQVLAMGKAVVVVGRDGRSYAMPDWPRSNTFWRGAQENLLIADNQTRMYQALDTELRSVYSAIAWGSSGEPKLANA